MKAIRSMLFYIKTSFFFLFLNDELVFFKLEPMLSGYWKGRRRAATRDACADVANVIFSQF